MRLDKFLVDCGVGSRTEVKQLLKQKKIAVNGKKETAGKLQIDPDKDQVTFMGEDLVHETFVYYLLNKPAGVISATEDDRHQTVLDLLDETARHKEVFPVGRLDIDTHGLLLLTIMASSPMPCFRRRSMCRRSTVPKWLGSWMRQM